MLQHIHVARFASCRNLNFLVEASDWFTGRSSQLGGGKTSFASFQNVEGSNSKSKLKSLKEGIGLCNSEKQTIWWDWGWSEDTYGIGDMPWKDLSSAYQSLKDAVMFVIGGNKSLIGNKARCPLCQLGGNTVHAPCTHCCRWKQSRTTGNPRGISRKTWYHNWKGTSTTSSEIVCVLISVSYSF